jgi:hypothetical protein
MTAGLLRSSAANPATELGFSLTFVHSVEVLHRVLLPLTGRTGAPSGSTGPGRFSRDAAMRSDRSGGIPIVAASGHDRDSAVFCPSLAPDGTYGCENCHKWLIVAAHHRQNGSKALWQWEIRPNKKKATGLFRPRSRLADQFSRTFLGKPPSSARCKRAESGCIRASTAPKGAISTPSEGKRTSVGTRFPSGDTRNHGPIAAIAFRGL